MPHSWIGAMFADSYGFILIHYFVLVTHILLASREKYLGGRFFETVRVYSVITFDSLDGYRILLEAIFF